MTEDEHWTGGPHWSEQPPDPVSRMEACIDEVVRAIAALREEEEARGNAAICMRTTIEALSAC
jgi:hypothetical protein